MYKVFGFDWFGNKFYYEYNNFIQAIQAYRDLRHNTTFISGISEKVFDKIK